MKKMPIKVHTANALRWLGSLYRTPADALKEHISNAVDEHTKALGRGTAVSKLEVVFTMAKDRIEIAYAYGMSEKEFQGALQRVADSEKRDAKDQIGQLGIGILSFMQIGTRCDFYSRKGAKDQTFKVTLKEGEDAGHLEMCSKHESLSEPGIRIVISGLRSGLDPTKPRGPVSVAQVTRAFAEIFDADLRRQRLSIVVIAGGVEHHVKPKEIQLPPIGRAYADLPVPRDPSKIMKLDLYFQPAGKGVVRVCHMGVAVVNDIRTLSASGYGLEESVYASVDVCGSIHADFLTPLPSRSGFDPNQDWVLFIDALLSIEELIQKEVDELKRTERDRKLSEIQRKAIELAREILKGKEFEGMDLLAGHGRKPPKIAEPAHGFDFVPPSKRMDVGQSASLTLKSRVPSVIPEAASIRVWVDGDAVELLAGEFRVPERDCDKESIVTTLVPVKALKLSSMPILVTAEAAGLRAEARIRVAPVTPIRGPEGPGAAGANFSLNEINFEDAAKHSRFSTATGMVEVNRLNEDYRAESSLDDEAKLAYSTLMIGKEVIALNDPTGTCNNLLEKMLTFNFRLKRAVPQALKKPRGRPRKAAYEMQAT